MKLGTTQGEKENDNALDVPDYFYPAGCSVLAGTQD
jgi:hypothetical protein